MAEYAIVIEHRQANWRQKTDAERTAILERYFAWRRDLEIAGRYVTSHSLGDDGGRVLQIVDGQVVDGPFTETKEIVGGFVIFEATDWKAATEVAKGCPAVAIGDRVQLREVSHLERP